MTPFPSSDDCYRLPPQSVIDIIDAQPEPNVLISPDGRHLLLIESDAMPDIADLARPMQCLAGLRIDPQSNSTFQTSFRKALRYQRVSDAMITPDGDHRDEGSTDASLGNTVNDDQTIEIDVAGLLTTPAAAAARPDVAASSAGSLKPKIGWVNWSHNSRDFVFTLLTESGTALYAANVDRLTPTLIRARISNVLNGIQWMPCGTQLMFAIVPDHLTPPDEPAAPIGPRIEQSDGEISPTRTFQDLLKHPHDEDLFQYHATTEIVIADVHGQIKHHWPRDQYAGVSIAPDGNHFLVKRLRHPYSYLLPWYQFAMTVDVSSPTGKFLCKIADIPLAENIPIEGVRIEPRMIHWMSSRPATVCYTTALDGGDPEMAAEFRDQVSLVEGPFETGQRPETKPLMKVQHRHYGMTYFAAPNLMITTEYDRDRRWVSHRLYDVEASTTDGMKIADRSIRDKYNDPGRLVQRSDAQGHSIVDCRGDFVFRAGAGASEVGNRPFLDRQNLKTLQTERLWQCDPQALESVVKLLPPAGASTEGRQQTLTWLTSHQTPSLPPNLHVRHITDRPRPTPTNRSFQLTHFGDPTPQIRGIKKEIVTYRRSDGVQLSSTLYLPADHQPGQRLPLLLWAYPLEFNDPSTAGQVSGSSQRFTRIVGISHLTLVTQGYAVMDNATMPVIGDPKTMNDTFIQQIVDAAQSAVDFAVQRGVADADRVAVGGHSYGAFMTANLLAHSDIFKAGIARSGAYNRTLTPFGFQSERRSFWDAKHVYNNISPFMFANQILTPLLIMHGELDNNPGTFPLQSERLYQAIKGNGGTSRLVVLPYESHGYLAQQSVLHTQAEMILWLDKHLK